MIIFKAIKTIVVLTAQDPDNTQSTDQSKNEIKDSLLNNIKDGGYAYIPAIRTLSNGEKPFAVFNMSFDTAKGLCHRYRKTSFVFTQLQDDGVIHSEYWETTDDNHNGDYVKKDEYEKSFEMQDTTDLFIITGNHFKYMIPFAALLHIDALLADNIKHIVEVCAKRFRVIKTENEVLDFALYRVGMPPHLWRKAITKGFYDNQP